MKTFIFKSFALLFIFAFHSNVTLANNNPPTFGTAKADSGGVDHFCEIDIEVNIFLASLEQYASNSNGQQTGIYYVPSEVGPMYLEYELDGFHSTTINMAGVEFKPHSYVNGHVVFKAIINIEPINFVDECTENEGGLLEYTQRLTLWKDNRPDSDYFASCDHTHPYQIFSCAVFDHTAQFCSASPPECDDEDLSVAESDLSIACNDCGEQNDSGEDQQQSRMTNPSELVTVSPNPAINEITVAWNNDAVIQSMLLYDLNGRVINSINNFDDLLSNTKTMNISHLSPGIYFLKTQTSKETVVTKIIKN